MRYKDCTDDDITFLKSRVSNARINGPTVKDDIFQDVSIITAWNMHKDEINRLGVERFARETGQELVDFYSNDSLKRTKNAVDDDDSVKFRSNYKPIQLKNITDDLQSVLWNQPLSATSQHLPGKLRLCVGLPVMIRYNSATELCMTKGQEGTIHTWQATVDGLPLNVVPLTLSATTIEVNLPSQEHVNITREQVEVLPNFSMTDYASQGKMRAYNVVDIAKCRSHQALYTCLSHSATAAGTLILQKWTEDISAKVQGRASSALRQEFRELELLDEITRLRYNSKLDPRVLGLTWTDQIRAYRMVKGAQYVPSCIHRSIRWSDQDPFVENELSNGKWCIVSEEKPTVKDKFVPAQGSVKLSAHDVRTHHATDVSSIHKANKAHERAETTPSWSERLHSTMCDTMLGLHGQRVMSCRKRRLSNEDDRDTCKKVPVEGINIKLHPVKPTGKDETAIAQETPKLHAHNIRNQEMADTPINHGPDEMHECNQSILLQNEHSHHMTDENMVIFQEQGTVSGQKRCLSHEEDGNAHKRVRVEGTDVRLSSVRSLEGLEWSNNSCTYDAMLSILYNVWKQDTARWVADFERLNKEWLKALSDLFRQHRDNKVTLEEARDKFRRGLARRYPVRLRFRDFTFMSDLLECLFTGEDMIRAAVLECPEGHHVPNTCINNNSTVFIESHSDCYSSVREWLHEQWNLTDIRWRACRICNNRLRRRHVWIRAPEILAFTSINGRLKTVDEKLVVVVDGVQKQYGLSGTIYHGQEHFTARVERADPGNPRRKIGHDKM
ncbi:hypothetical protein EDD18DRAFT_1358347 [Armillaria luteobubalina]|uniref:DNA helicase n=1 Tax=Armillaria luteobubalina TaxID=153913 RepID=A0AA39PZE0_9AGAR|nr:hypothetical protein EDD18DRAFT_1358347 [Armillaria luteobubalina]